MNPLPLSKFSVLLSSLFLAASLNAQPKELLIAAASDLAPLESQLAKLFTKQAPVRFVYGSSGQLSSQIANGAPYDVFLSASPIYIEILQQSKNATDPTPFARGRLAIWSPKNDFSSINQLLQSKGTIAIANPDHAPYGLAAKQALEKAGIWLTLQPRIVLGENVRQAYQFAESGNATVCLTSWSLVKNRGGVPVPENLHQPIIQTGAVVASSKQANLAREFLKALTSKEGQAILKSAGFEIGRI